MSKAPEAASRPKSMRHKRILDAADDDPSASIDDLARMVPSATPDLVERVLEEYGDPAEEGGTEEDGVLEPTPDSLVPGDDEDQPDGPTTADADDTVVVGDEMKTVNEATDNSVELSEPTPDTTETDAASAANAPQVDDVVSLSPAERETLRAIQVKPEATQRALAEELGVSAATVSQRVNGIDGFEWNERASFVANLFGGEASDDVSQRSLRSSDDTPKMTKESDTVPADDSVTETTDASVAKALHTLEAHVELLLEQQTSQSAFDDPELVAKVVRACLDAETISEDEELKIIQTLMN